MIMRSHYHFWINQEPLLWASLSCSLPIGFHSLHILKMIQPRSLRCLPSKCCIFHLMLISFLCSSIVCYGPLYTEGERLYGPPLIGTSSRAPRPSYNPAISMISFPSSKKRRTRYDVYTDLRLPLLPDHHLYIIIPTHRITPSRSWVVDIVGHPWAWPMVSCWI